MGKTWICTECSKFFSSKQALKRHQETACNQQISPKIIPNISKRSNTDSKCEDHSASGSDRGSRSSARVIVPVNDTRIPEEATDSIDQKVGGSPCIENLLKYSTGLPSLPGTLPGSLPISLQVGLPDTLPSSLPGGLPGLPDLDSISDGDGSRDAVISFSELNIDMKSLLKILDAREAKLLAKLKKYDREKELERQKASQRASGSNSTKNAEKGQSTADKSDDDNEKDPKIDIVCLAKGDYIKKLIQLHDGDEEKAMNYIKNVGVATDFLECDFRLIKKVYFDGKQKSQFPIRVKDFKRNKLEFLEENGEWVLDIRGEIVGRRLCENIISTLLLANNLFNDVIIAEKDEDRKELLLDLFQINRTQAHIMKLMERKTQCKLSRRVAEFINYCSEVQAATGSLENVKKAYS